MSDALKKKKYTVNLPKTPFPMRASLAQREPERLKIWAEESLEKKIRAKAEKRKETFILHDGPPYANGHIHIGHALNKILKDMIVKYNAHLGRNALYVPGWDCHGLPIEHALLKDSGKQKDEVNQLEFRKKARAYADKFVGIQKGEFRRLGIFGEWDNPYLTMDTSYQTAIARSFFELYEKGYIYRGEKPVYWSVGCETALAEAELEYQEKTSEAIFVSFPLADRTTLRDLHKTLASDPARPVSFLIWTTTPWTLPANVGIAFHAELQYGFYSSGQKEILIFATALEKTLSEKLALKDLKLLKTLDGKSLKKLVPKYRHPFIERDGAVLLADYVSGEEGTGIVHIAPGHGEDDYVYGHLQNKLPILSPVNHKGQFTENFGEGLSVKNVNVFKANALIIDHLKTKGLLKGLEEHRHSYPFCWRSKTPVIVRSTPQWFLKIDHKKLRERLLGIIRDARQTKWFPDWGKNRILRMIESRPDWCLSRQRLWGVPIPVAYHKKDGKIYLTEEFKKNVLRIFEKEGADAWFTRPLKDFLGKDSGSADQLAAEKDILDVWFDSGVSHQAVLEPNQALGFPAGLYLEGSDQHRGWFQTSLITAVALRGKSPFRQVLTHGFVVDGAGKKMSKSLGNVVSPQDVMKKYGADILRLWVSSCDTNQDVRMSPEILERMSEAYRKIRNTFRYLLGNLADFDPQKDRVPFRQMEPIDRWLLSRLKEVADEVLVCYENYKFHRIYQIIHDFCIMDLSAFYLDALKDRLYCEAPGNPARKSSQSALFLVTRSLCQLTAPILSFTADEVWRSFAFGPEKSVHETVWEKSQWADEDKSSFEQWNALRQIRRQSDLAIEAMRQTKAVGSPLDCRVVLISPSKEAFEFLKKNIPALELALIVSSVTVKEGSEGAAGESFEFSWQGPDHKTRTERVAIRIEKAEGKKCARCWKYLPEVGSLEDATLCKRCFDVERQLR